MGDCQIRGPGLEVLIDVRKRDNVSAEELREMVPQRTEPAGAIGSIHRHALISFHR
jgi:hypothetical protein